MNRGLSVKRPFAAVGAVSGTAYAFSIQPKHYGVSESQDAWVEPDDKARTAIVALLRLQTRFSPPCKTEYYDRRTQNSCSPPSLIELPSDLPEVVVLRPPRLTSKNDVSAWLSLVAGSLNESPIRPAKAFVLADLTPFQMLTFRDLLLNVQIYSETQLDLYLVSENWSVSCVTTFPGSRRFVKANDKALNFLNVSEPHLEFSAPHLAVLLRQMDSEVFWYSGGEQVRDPFFNQPVDWYRSSTNPNNNIVLQRYLDLPHALADPVRYRACRRALRRCFGLYPGYQVVGADDLVASLVRDSLLHTYADRDEASSKTLIVGSVAVTGETVNELNEQNKCESLHIMINNDVHGRKDFRALSAILWISQLTNTPGPSVSQTELDQPHLWRRIPNTPFVAPLGEQSVSILRYSRREGGRYDFERPLYGRTPEDTYNDFRRLSILKNGHWNYNGRHDLLTINIRLAFRFSFLELGPLYDWLRGQFRMLFSAPDPGQRAPAQLLIYPSHPVTDSMLDRIRQDQGFADILPEGGMIPVKFLGVHTVSPLLASHLVGHRIREQVEARSWKDWSAVVFDDGAVSGKHMRELTQFLQGLKARTVYTLALLDRTGLPAQEAVLGSFFARHKRFWRWDVPALGNKRDCPLCQGLAIAQTYSDRLPSERQKQRLTRWIEDWRVRDVDTEWYRRGLRAIPFARPIQVTFGVDEQADGERLEKHLLLDNSTSATSLLLELTRLTTRSDTTIKKAKGIQATYPDAAIEMISSQLLLFLDELTLEEKCDRFIRLLRLIWTRDVATHATSLAGLCLTLADHEVLVKIWDTYRTELLPKQRLANLDGIIAAYILNSRHTFVTKERYVFSLDAGDIARHNYIMLGATGGFHQVIRDFMVALCHNPVRQGYVDTHNTEIRRRLVALAQFRVSIGTDKLREHAWSVLQDMQRVEQIFKNMQSELIVDISPSDLAKLNNYANQLEERIREFEDSTQDRDAIAASLVRLGDDLSTLLYGEKEGLVRKVAGQILTHFDNSDEFDNVLVAGMVRTVRIQWPDILSKKASGGQNIAIKERWQRKDGSIIYPTILCSTNADLQEFWLYADSFVRDSLEDTLLNVYHANGQFKDPWSDDQEKSASGPVAHLWWRIEHDENYIVFKTANRSANQKISLRQKVSFAGLERAGGSVNVKIVSDNSETSMAYVILRLPLHSAFIKEET
jgi:hypothetical protein